MYCKVKNCRYKYSHTTKGHKCGKCNKYGHGQVECNNENLKNELKEYYGECFSVEDQCSVLNCDYSKYHITEAHECSYCNVIGHAEYECDINVNYEKIICPICSKVNVIDDKQRKIFGLEEKCKVCKDNTINIYFPECGHACLCDECFDQIKEY
tara:strand:+ start:621 stop:1082 length:462 start_codon:yes stop_codon:yes gene_type:complete